MLETKIYGASDDLIELDGQLTEEFNPEDGVPALLAFSDGTLLEVEYDADGIWRIKRLAEGACAYEHTQGSVTQNTPDTAVLRGELAWCVLAERGQYNPCFAKKE